MAWNVRHLVSKKKKRYIEGGFDLDLTCIFSYFDTICNYIIHKRRRKYFGSNEQLREGDETKIVVYKVTLLCLIRMNHQRDVCNSVITSSLSRFTRLVLKAR